MKNQNIRIYHSFKDFMSNYDNDLNEWLSLYPDAEEKSYIQTLQGHYSYWFEYAKEYKFDILEKSIGITLGSDYMNELNYDVLTPFEFVSHINRLLTEVQEDISVDNYSDIVSSQSFIDVIEYKRIYSINDVISFAQLLEFNQEGNLILYKHKFKNLGLSIPKIQSFIKAKINDEGPNDTVASIDASDQYYYAEGDPKNLLSKLGDKNKYVEVEGNKIKLTYRMLALVLAYKNERLISRDHPKNREIALKYGFTSDTSGQQLHDYLYVEKKGKASDLKHRTMDKGTRKNNTQLQAMKVALQLVEDEKIAMIKSEMKSIESY